MQILYLLVLGDKSNVLYGKDLCFNANYRFTHEFIDGDEDKVKVSWEIKDIIPDNFFTTRENNKNCCIDNVSEIIGINGSGKTLIFKTLLKILSNPHFDYEIKNIEIVEKIILIYKKDDKFYGRYIIIEKSELSSWRNKIVYEFDCSEKNNNIFTDTEKNKIIEENNKNRLAIETDLVYLCNHYCFNWDNLTISGKGFHDYSTAGRFRFDDNEHAYSDLSRICINSHYLKEMERIIKFLYYFYETNDKLSKTKDNNLNQLINNIEKKKVKILWNRNIIDKAYNDALQMYKSCNNLSAKEHFLDISKTLEFDQLPIQANFFFITFLGFIASRFLEFITYINVDELKSKNFIIDERIIKYCYLAKQIIDDVKNSKNNIHYYSEQILNTIKDPRLPNQYKFFKYIYDFFHKTNKDCSRKK